MASAVCPIIVASRLLPLEKKVNLCVRERKDCSRAAVVESRSRSEDVSCTYDVVSKELGDGVGTYWVYGRDGRLCKNDWGQQCVEGVLWYTLTDKFITGGRTTS